MTIDPDDLDMLLWLARRGDVAVSQRTWRHGFRRSPVCSDPATRDPDCPQCRAFTKAEAALNESRHSEDSPADRGA